jgi:hypothetical protein
VHAHDPVVLYAAAVAYDLHSRRIRVGDRRGPAYVGYRGVRDGDVIRPHVDALECGVLNLQIIELDIGRSFLGRSGVQIRIIGSRDEDGSMKAIDPEIFEANAISVVGKDSPVRVTGLLRTDEGEISAIDLHVVRIDQNRVLLERFGVHVGIQAVASGCVDDVRDCLDVMVAVLLRLRSRLQDRIVIREGRDPPHKRA